MQGDSCRQRLPITIDLLQTLIPVPLTMGKTDQLKIMDQTAVSLESSYCIVLAP